MQREGETYRDEQTRWYVEGQEAIEFSSITLERKKSKSDVNPS